MKAWVGVFDHPYFAVTNEKGDFNIQNIPPGKYEVVFWQERLSNIDEEIYIIQNSTLEINITDNQNTTQNFTFNRPVKK